MLSSNPHIFQNIFHGRNWRKQPKQGLRICRLQMFIPIHSFKMQYFIQILTHIEPNNKHIFWKNLSKRKSMMYKIKARPTHLKLQNVRSQSYTKKLHDSIKLKTAKAAFLIKHEFQIMFSSLIRKIFLLKCNQGTRCWLTTGNVFSPKKKRKKNTINIRTIAYVDVR